MIRHLPSDSATAIAVGGPGWTLAHYMLADLFHATAGKPHPGLPDQARAADPVRAKKMRQALARQRERQRAIDAGEIT